MASQLRNDIAEVRDDGHTVLVDMAGERYLGINETGTAIWHGLKRGLEAPEIAAELATAYGIPPTVALEDVLRFIDTLVADGLVLRGGRR